MKSILPLFIAGLAPANSFFVTSNRPVRHALLRSSSFETIGDPKTDVINTGLLVDVLKQQRELLNEVGPANESLSEKLKEKEDLIDDIDELVSEKEEVPDTEIEESEIVIEDETESVVEEESESIVEEESESIVEEESESIVEEDPEHVAAGMFEPVVEEDFEPVVEEEPEITATEDSAPIAEIEPEPVAESDDLDDDSESSALEEE
eukprot:9821324-Ditylum_brightwellii.AAC.1